MRLAGVQVSFEKLNDFLNKHAYGIQYGKGKISYFARLSTNEEAEEARALEHKLFGDLNVQIDQAEKAPRINSEYNRILQWNLNKDPREYLSYVDTLRISPPLKPRPVVTLVYHVDFWLNEVPEEESLRSSLTAWLSPTSNSIDLFLNFPPSMIGQDFEVYRERLQIDCPVKIEGKYLRLRNEG